MFDKLSDEKLGALVRLLLNLGEDESKLVRFVLGIREEKAEDGKAEEAAIPVAEASAIIAPADILATADEEEDTDEVRLSPQTAPPPIDTELPPEAPTQWATIKQIAGVLSLPQQTVFNKLTRAGQSNQLRKGRKDTPTSVPYYVYDVIAVQNVLKSYGIIDQIQSFPEFAETPKTEPKTEPKVEVKTAPEKPAGEPVYYTLSELGRMFKMPHSHVYNMIRASGRTEEIRRVAKNSRGAKAHEYNYQEVLAILKSQRAS